MHKSNAGQVKDWPRVSEWLEVGEVFVSVRVRRKAEEKQAVEVELVSKNKKRKKKKKEKDESSPWHQLNSRTNAHTRTKECVKVGYMSHSYTQVHDVQLTSDSQLIGQIKMMDLKRNYKKKEKEKQN